MWKKRGTCRQYPAGTDSITENIHPDIFVRRNRETGEMVEQETTALSVMMMARETPSGARPCRSCSFYHLIKRKSCPLNLTNVGTGWVGRQEK
jgi:hypothetical protein